ncbi:MAG: class I SAM-dependent methyltransferase, partial [Alphaproteobacteria bacterium]|nr:class I SAM-dependent methyltransferase [Alphaproteobacteria bacterium]
MLGLILSPLMRRGTLEVVTADGARRSYGAGEPRVTVRFHDRAGPWQLGLRPDFMLGQLYMDGRMTVEGGSIADVLELLLSNLSQSSRGLSMGLGQGWRTLTRRLSQFNPSWLAKAHVAHHYDLSDELYELFLDKDKQYSCAYFTSPQDSLEDAQAAKKRHIAAKLLLDKPGLKVLDIGCGWGGMALELALEHGADVLGVTLSENQIAIARERAQAARIAQRCHFELVDYRALRGTYDRIVSVGMFEHVGAAYFSVFFDKIRQLLADDGVMLLHTIGRLDGPGATNPWISKYIFPGGYVPALSEVMRVVEKSGLFATDVEVLRLHYAETLKEWRRRFMANRDKAVQLYDERFCRMWEFYLAGS